MAPLAKRAPDLNLPQKICQKRFLEVKESTKRVEKVLVLVKRTSREITATDHLEDHKEPHCTDNWR
jgi:hypothetical protein